MIYSIENNDEKKDSDELDLQSKVKFVRLVENLGKQGFHYGIKRLFEPITQAATDSSQKIIEETKSNAKAFLELDESIVFKKTLELMNKNGVNHSSLSRPIAKHLVPENKSHFRLHDDPDSDNWNDY